MRRVRIHILAAVVPAVLMACSADPPEQQQSMPLAPSLAVNDGITPNGAFYPLAEGNEWHYRYRLEMQLIPDDGPAPPPEVLDDTVVRSQGDTWVPIGTAYRTEWDDHGDGQVSVNLFRQDRRGLYMFDLLVTDSPSSDATRSSPRAAESSPMSRVAAHLSTRAHLDPECVAEHVRKVSIAKASAGSSPGDGLKPEEVLILAYPLHPGASWVVRTVPMVRSTVEGIDPIAGSPAYRVRIDNELLDPADVVYYWYGHCGLSQYRLHVESPATDLDGAVIGRLVTEESWELLSVDIDRGGCDVHVDYSSAAGGVNSYPIAVGNRWTYEIRSWDPLLYLETVYIADNEQTAWVDVDGRTYMKEVMTARAPVSLMSVDYVRQDHDGLYRAGPPAPPWRAGIRAAVRGVTKAISNGAGNDEATTLVYPLKPGASWTILEGEILGRWTATVEGKERLTLPAGQFNAVRIRITRDDDLPGTETRVWYGSAGLLKVSAHVRTVDGFADVEWTLEDVSLVR